MGDELKPTGSDEQIDEAITTDESGEQKDKPAQPPAEMTEDEKRLKAAANEKLAGEAAAHRVARRKAEEELAKQTAARVELEKELSDLKKSHVPQRTTEDESEIATLRRNFAELQVELKAQREENKLDKARAKADRVSGHIAKLLSGDEFQLKGALSQLLEKVVKVEDGSGLLVMDVVSEDGDKLSVAATVENLLRFKPVVDFQDFVKSKGSSGSGSGRPGNGKPSPDGIDWAKVKSNDTVYMQTPGIIEKIMAARAQGKGN